MSKIVVCVTINPACVYFCDINFETGSLYFKSTNFHKNNRDSRQILAESSISYTEMVNFMPQNKHHTEDWALGCQPGDNGHVTDWT